MSLPSPAALRNLRVGNDAGWLLAFHRELPDGTIVEAPERWIGSDDVHAEIRASLQSGLEGGVYSFKVERLPEADYRELVKRENGRRVLGVAKLYLFWRDALGGVGDYLTGLAGLSNLGDITPMTAGEDPVAVLAITDLSRAVGRRGVETTITCRERVFQWLSERTLCGGPDETGIDLATVETALSTAIRRLGLERQTRVHSLSPSPRDCPGGPPSNGAGSGRQQLANGTGGVECMRTLGDRIEQRTRLYGRGMLLVRGGVLHIGKRTIPLDEADGVKDLSVESGLVDAQPLAPVLTDPSFDRCANPAAEPPRRAQYKLICKGRPDLRPGDVVRFGIPQEDAEGAGFGVVGLAVAAVTDQILPSLGGVTDPSMKLYVNSVEHRLGRTSGFSTTVTGVELRDGVPDWDCRSQEQRSRGDAGGQAANAETDAARAVRAVSEEAARARAAVDVGEVRGAQTSTGEHPAQSLVVWRGLAGDDGDANGSARLEVARPSPAPASGAPYLTPFAFGKAGLVLPRYPGMRVAMAHRLDEGDDPLVAGALWMAGDAPASQAGDWWLILPAAVPADKRQSLPDSDTTAPASYTEKASDDLIDADGNRVIEAGELTIRIGDAALQPAGTRPERAGAQKSVTVEHADAGSKIVMEAGGKITIEAGGDLEIKAANVKVQVSGTMDVGPRT